MKFILATSLALLGSATASDLSGVKTYLNEKLQIQIEGTKALSDASDDYYKLASANGFDYKKLATSLQAKQIIIRAREAWHKASPAYEAIEGIVAGIDSLKEFDIILDAGTHDGEDAVPFDLKLPSGLVMPKPGNLFGITEGSLWATVPSWNSGIFADFNGNSKIDIGEKLPEANILKAAANMLNTESQRLKKTADTWQPSETDVFGALVVNIPTVGPTFFEDWKSSPFVLGKNSKRKDFVTISRLSDLCGNISSWQAMYKGLSPDIRKKNETVDNQIIFSMNELYIFVDKMAKHEKTHQYTSEQADRYEKEAQNRATLIAGLVTQASAIMGVKLK